MFAIFSQYLGSVVFLSLSVFIQSRPIFFSIFCKCCYSDFFKFSSSSPTDYKLFLSSHIEKDNRPSAELQFIILF